MRQLVDLDPLLGIIEEAQEGGLVLTLVSPASGELCTIGPSVVLARLATAIVTALDFADTPEL